MAEQKRGGFAVGAAGRAGGPARPFLFVLIAAILAAGSIAAVALIPSGPASERASAGGGLVTQDLTQGLSPAQLAAALVSGSTVLPQGNIAGQGISISNVTYTGAPLAAGTFSGGGSIVGFASGIVLGSGAIAGAAGPNTLDDASNDFGGAGDINLNSLSGFSTYDAAALEFDFIPQGSTLSFSYVFGSDEYNEWVHQPFNDVFAFYVNGVDCALVGGQPVSVNTINNGNPFGSDPRERPDLYRNNDASDGGAGINTELDGLTVVLSCQAPVIPNNTNHVKLVIADASDGRVNSAVFIQAGSFTIVPPPTPTGTATRTRTATRTPTRTPTWTPSHTPTRTNTPLPPATPTVTLTARPTASGTPTPTWTPLFFVLPADTATPTPTATATPTSTVVPAPTLGSDVLGSTEPPDRNDSDVQRLLGLASPADVSTDSQVIATNIYLAVILLLVLLFSSTIFNQTLEEHRVEFDALLLRLTSPLRTFLTWAEGPAAGGIAAALAGPMGPVAVILLCAGIYTFNDADAGFNEGTLVLFSSLALAVAIMTYVYDGGEAFLTRRRYHLDAGVKLFPIAIGIAAFFVTLSRLADFSAPIMYGFVAAPALLAPGRLDRRAAAIVVALPALALLGLSVLAWLLIPAFNDLTGDSGSWWARIPPVTAGVLFAGGIEGLLFSMIPLRFTDGAKIFNWNVWVWALIFGVPAFLFAWVILNPQAQEFDALVEGRVIVTMALVGAYAMVGVATWLFFFLRRFGDEREHASAGPPSG